MSESVDRMKTGSKNVLFRKVIVCFIAVSMVLCQCPVDIFAGDGNSADSAVINVNGESAALSSGFTNARKVAYGDSLKLTLTGVTYTGTPDYLYVDGSTILSGSTQWNTWSDTGYPKEPGNYYLGFGAEIDGSRTEIASDKFGFTITRATLATPSGLAWSNGSTATWTSVTKTATGTALDSGAVKEYSVALYRDGLKVNTVTTSATTYDFTDVMKATKGVYTFKVTAVSNSSVHYNDSEESLVSGNAESVAFSVSGDNGIDSVSPETAILIAGNSEYNRKTFNAVVKTGREFDKWESSVSGLTLSGTTGEALTVTLPLAYYGFDTVTLTASTVDKTAPVISSFAAGTGTKYGWLQGTATDAGSGISAYAFSTKTDQTSLTSGDWTALSSSEASADLEQKVSASGTYYLYVKDGSGNVTRSTSSIQATEVVYEDYYSNNAKTDLTEYLVGTSPLTLKTPNRSGYVFGGWYKASGFTGDAVTAVSSHSSEAVHVYAKWTRESISFTSQPKNIDTTYDDTEHTLSVAVSNYGTVTYQWYKDGSAISGATSASYKVKNAADSGTYKVLVKVTIDGTDVSAYSSEATVRIAKKAVTITADNKSATYGDDAPTYTWSISGLAGNDTRDDSISAGTVTSSYKKGSDAAGYDIVPAGFSSDNYSISYVNGTLTVSPKAISGLTMSLDKTDFTYTGQGIEPTATVKDGETTVDSANYALTYENNVDQGTGTAILTFKKNYTGEKKLSFTIARADVSANVIIDGWTYGNKASTPQVSNNPGSAAVTYYYSDSETGTGTATQPVNAGTYYVYAVIAATNNYNQCTTGRQSFVIAKRQITLTASPGTWPFDGNAHSSSLYSQTGDFAGSDGFKSVQVSGSITNVGQVPNKVTYVLTSSTNKDNYNIQCVDKMLTITAVQLNTPTGCKWSSASAGTAEWVASARTGLTVSYDIQLYRVGSDTPVNTVNSSTNSFDFASMIKADCQTRGTTGQYYFKVRTVPAGGINKDNYTSSEYSAAASNINTVKFSLVKDDGIQSAAVGGATAGYLLQGETVALSAALKTGYSFASDIWTSDNIAVRFTDATAGETTVQISSSLTAPADVIIYAHSSDDEPVIGAFTADYGTGGQVTFNLKATDTKAISQWAISTNADAPAASDWNQASGTDINVTRDVTQEGKYYAYVKDDSGQVVRYEQSISVYQIQFSGNTGVGTMSSILKIQNKSLKLPANTFTREGYYFQVWNGTSGSYSDKGTYTANSSDTLSAQWTDQQLQFTVEYYLMDTSGSYPTAATSTRTFTASYGSQISTDNETLALVKTGMALDTSADKTSSITLNKSGQTLKIYYKRLKYNVTYSYTRPGESSATKTSVEYYYGAAITDLTKPSEAGYSFVG